MISVTSSYSKRTGLTTTTTSGQLLWYSTADNSAGSNGWRLKAAINSSTTGGGSPWQPFTCPGGVGTAGSSPRFGRFTATGILQERNGAGGWVPTGAYGSGGVVTFTVTLYDGGSVTTCTKKTCKQSDLTDLFGISIVGVTPPASTSDPVPQVGDPVIVRSGSIKVS